MKALCLILLVCTAYAQEVPLWPNSAPGSEGKTAKEEVEPPNASHGYLKVTGVYNPSNTAFLPDAAKPTVRR